MKSQPGSVGFPAGLQPNFSFKTNQIMFGILVFALIPVVSIVLGGVVGLLKKESGAFNSAVLHFAAGVVFRSWRWNCCPTS